MVTFFSGRIDITDNLPFVLEVLQNPNPNVVVINLDEDNQQLKSSQNVLGGTELLPPPEALMAEIDGDEQMYDYIYSLHFTDPFVIQYVTALIAALYQGKSLLMYYPTLDPSETKTVPKLVDQFWNNFGIGIGIVNHNDGVYDYNKLPLWLRMLYLSRIIDVRTFLSQYPLGCSVESPIMDLLLSDLKPYADDLQNQINYVMQYWAHLKNNPQLKIPFHKV